MKTTPTILIGQPLHDQHEAAFLRTLCTDLAGLDALIIANFVVDSRQIDFVVVTPTNAVLIELKNYRGAVFGDRNGDWSVRDLSGNVVPDGAHNLYAQTVRESYALSDAMRADQIRTRSAPAAAQGRFYNLYSTHLCFYPDIPAGSDITRGDRKARISGYADVLATITDKTIVGWSMSEWEAFAKRTLRVTPATLEAAVDTRVLAAHAALTAYRVRLESILGTNLAPMLESDGDAHSGADVIRALQGPHHYLLHGPSGSAKTFHLTHLAIATAAETNEIPFPLDAKRYRGGEFRAYLRQALSPFCSDDTEVLLAAIKDAGRTPLVLIDALNECPESLRNDLLHAAQAFALRYDARIVITAQSADTSLAGLHAQPVALALPRKSQKRQIYAFHAGIEPTPAIESFCVGFETAYDLQLAGSCHAMGFAPAVRADLYDRYVTSSLPEDSAFVAGALLRHIAGHMREKLSVALSRRTFDELSERFLIANEAKISLLDALAATRLIKLTSDSFSFEHELLLTYLQAEQLRRTDHDMTALAVELAKPRNAHLIEFILPRVGNEGERDALIAAVTNEAVLEKIFRGELGADAKATLHCAVAAFIDSATNDVTNWGVDFQTERTDEDRTRFVAVHVSGARAWSPYEMRLADLLAPAVLDPNLREPALRLLDVSEARLRTAVETRAAEMRFRFTTVWSETMRFYGGVFSHPGMLPCAEMLVALQQRMRPFAIDPAFAEVRRALIERAMATPPSDFAKHLLLEDHDLIASSERLAANLDLIESAWKSGVGTLQLNAAHAFHFLPRVVNEAEPALKERALAILETFESKNLMLNSLILELKSLFAVIPPPVSVDDALAELRVCIAPSALEDPGIVALAELEHTPPLHVLASQAYHLLGRIFEDFFQNSYDMAIAELDDDERFALFALAAQSPDRGFHSEWILRKLLDFDRPESLQHFAAIVQNADFTTGFLQDEVAAVLIAIKACARWGTAPPVFGTTTKQYGPAFDTVAHALFLAWRPAMTPVERDGVLAKWRALTDEDRLAAGAIIASVHSAMTMFLHEDREAHKMLTKHWPEEAESVLLACIERRNALAPLHIVHRHDGGLVFHAIETVGSIGSARSLLPLRALSEDPVFGGAAVQALAILQRRGIGVV